MEWIKEHQKSCNKDPDTCSECYIISESLSALHEAQEYMDNKKKQEVNKPQPIKKPVYDYRLREWRTE